MPLKLKYQVLKPLLPKSGKLLPYLEQIDENCWYTNFGPLYNQFNLELGRVFKGQNTTLTANGTQALEIAIASLNLPAGSRVLVPALTFPATVTAVLRLGLKPILGDIDINSWLLSPEVARQAHIEHSIQAAIPVAAFGNPVPANAWHQFVTDTKVPVIIDAAGAFGNQTCPDNCLTVFSMHATKAFSCGEGGLIVSNDQAHTQSLTSSTNFGIQNGKVSEDAIVVTNAKLSEYHCAVGLASLKLWPTQMRRRKKLLKHYLNKIAQMGLPLCIQPQLENLVLSMFCVRLPKEVVVDEFQQILANRGIETRRWYYPLICDHPFFNKLESASNLENSRQISSSLIGLPFHLHLNEEDIEFIVEEVATALSRSMKTAS